MTYEEAISELETIKRVYANMRKEYKPCVEALQIAIDLLRRADTPQTEKTCDNCGTPKDKCVYCIEEDRMWTPQTEEDRLREQCRAFIDMVEMTKGLEE